MNRTEFVRLVSRKMDQPQWAVDTFLTAIEDALTSSLAAEEPVNLRGFGKFDVRHLNAVTRANPRTGEPIAIPPRSTVRFLPSPKLRQRVNELN